VNRLSSQLRPFLKFNELRPSQKKALDAGLLEGKNLLICTPTASGKTLVAEIGIIENLIKNKGKGIYIVPLKALAVEKFKEFSSKYENFCKIGMSIADSENTHLSSSDLILMTSEKLDSLLRFKVPWLSDVGTIVIDEIHLLNDVSRGPTLEVVITLMRAIAPNAQIIGLSATIGNPRELADWLDAELIEDTWRPVELKQGLYHQGDLKFEDLNSPGL
jgi:helicase